jgi:hypothetical protein
MAKAGMARAVGAEDTPEVRLEEVWAFVVPWKQGQIRWGVPVWISKNSWWCVNLIALTTRIRQIPNAG